ncbi:MAG: CapA family protein [Leptospira sp.]|nr:CapA family protein [Leptospira sp.]
MKLFHRYFIHILLFLIPFTFLQSDVPDPIEEYEPILDPPYQDFYRYNTNTGSGFVIPNTTKIWVGGDVMFNWGVRDAMKGEDPLLPFRSFTSLLYNMDYRMLNLETPILHKSPNLDKLKSYVFYGVKSDLRVLTALQIDGVFLGNNHTMDLGESGLKDTLLSLSESKISYAGAGNTEEEAHIPLSFSKDGYEYRTYSFSDTGETRLFATPKGPGAAYFKVGTAERLIKKKKSNQVNLLSVHWGVEYSPEPTEVQRKTAKYLVGAGYQVILGHHPHVPQGIEVFPKGIVIYSLGNFLFGSKNSYLKHNISVVLHFTNGQLVCAEIIPVFGKHQNMPGDQYFSPLSGNEADEYLKEYAVLCKNLGTELIISGGRGYVFLDKELKAKLNPY